MSQEYSGKWLGTFWVKPQMDAFTPSELLSHLRDHIDMMLDECRENGWIGVDSENSVRSLKAFLDLEIQFHSAMPSVSPPATDYDSDPLFPDDDPGFHSECSLTCGCTLSPRSQSNSPCSVPEPTHTPKETSSVSMLRKLAENARKRRAE